MKSQIKSILLKYISEDKADIVSQEIANELFKICVEVTSRLFENFLLALKDEAKLAEGKPDD